jgi:uncharacterized protein (TIGR02996 family)
VREDEAFVAAIRAQPTDDTLRLVYADWLDERGDLRSAFLRLECRLHGMHEADPELRDLQKQLGELGGPLDVRWVAAVCRFHAEYGPAHQHPSRCPLTVAGPFYTCGTCLACEAPEAEAPDLLAPLGSGNYTTYFVRQPETAGEIERACGAAKVCCMSDLRYGGTDPRIIAQLGNSPEFCDNLLSEESPRLVSAPPRWREQTR